MSAKMRSEMVARREWRRTVLAASKGVCVAPETIAEWWPDAVDLFACDGPIDAHHVAPKGKFPELRLDPANGIALCRRHHDWVHNHHPNAARMMGLLR